MADKIGLSLAEVKEFLAELQWLMLQTQMEEYRRYYDKRLVSTSKAESCVDEIANARMGKNQRMRWSSRGAHRVAVVRVPVLDGRRSSMVTIPLAA